MKKITLALVALIALGASQKIFLDHSEQIAIKMAPKYVIPSDDEALRVETAECKKKEARDGSFSTDAYWCNRILKNEKLSIESGHRTIQAKFYDEHIEPIKEELEFWANLIFPVLYLVFGILLLFSAAKLVPVVLAFIAMIFASIYGAALRAIRASGISGVASRFEMRQIDKEFSRLKSFREDGLITAEEFETKKAAIRSRIKDNVIVKRDRQ